MSGSSCVIFVPDDTGRTGLPEPLMLRRAAGAPVLYWLAHSLADAGVSRVFLVCHEACLAAARACFPEDVRLTVSGGEETADLLHVFLSTDEEEAEELLVITGPALPLRFAPPDFDARSAPSCALSVRREALMQALDEDFHFAHFLRENGRVADAENGLAAVTGAAALQAWQPQLRACVLSALADAGVEIYDPQNCYVEPTVRVGRGTLLLPGCILRGSTVVGEDCTIGPDTLLQDATIGAGSRVNASQVTRSLVGRNAEVGPYACIRPGCALGDGVLAGSFVELERASVGRDAKLPRLAYAGDCELGERVQFGSGAATVNHDRVSMHRTTVGADAFIGADTQLVAPVRVGAGGYTGAGSIITEDVPAQALGVARAKQSNKRDWAARHKQEKPSGT